MEVTFLRRRLLDPLRQQISERFAEPDQNQSRNGVEHGVDASDAEYRGHLRIKTKQRDQSKIDLYEYIKEYQDKDCSCHIEHGVGESGPACLYTSTAGGDIGTDRGSDVLSKNHGGGHRERQPSQIGEYHRQDNRDAG